MTVTEKDREDAQNLWKSLTVQYGDAIEAGAKEIVRIREETIASICNSCDLDCCNECGIWNNPRK